MDLRRRLKLGLESLEGEVTELSEEDQIKLDRLKELRDDVDINGASVGIMDVVLEELPEEEKAQVSLEHYTQLPSNVNKLDCLAFLGKLITELSNKETGV